MKKILEHQVSFPVDAQLDNFTAALASALVIARGYTEETPYWCALKRLFAKMFENDCAEGGAVRAVSFHERYLRGAFIASAR